VLVLDRTGRELQRFSIPEPLRQWDITFLETQSGGAVMYTVKRLDERGMPAEYLVFQIGPDGRSQESTAILPETSFGWRDRMGFGLVVPAPAMLVGVLGVARIEQLFYADAEKTYSAAIARTFAEFWPALACAALIAVGLAVICYRRQVRFAASMTEQVVWPLFVVLFGLPGWIGYRFGRTWPVLHACPSCGRVVPHNRDTCARCAESFPRPALKGTEVFA
jgi:hypothetical protein